MPACRAGTTLLAAALSFAVASGPLPAGAQDQNATPPAGRAPATHQSLSDQVAKLAARVAKLEGNLTGHDLVGAYVFMLIDTAMSGFVAGNPPRHATITTFGGKAALTLNADQTFSLDGLACGGTLLTEGSWQLTETQCSNGQPAGTWSYADGAVTLVFADDGDEIPLDVSLGGRMLSTAFNSFHAADPSSDNGLWIATRK